MLLRGRSVREGSAMKPTAWVWLICAVALLIAAGLAFSGSIYPAAIVLLLVSGVLVAHRLR
ncbi:hypothetical protein GCM10027456_79500 [Kineosporia babensis]